MQVIDRIINLLGRSGQESETDYQEGFSMLLMTGFLAVMVIMVML